MRQYYLEHSAFSGFYIVEVKGKVITRLGHYESEKDAIKILCQVNAAYAMGRLDAKESK